MKKGIFIFLGLLCLIFALLISTTACSDKKSDNLDEFEQLLLSTEIGESEPFASVVYLVMPNDCSAELSARVRALAQKITDKTGVMSVAKYDDEALISDEKSLTLLVGNTNMALSGENMRALRENDYIFRYDRGFFVLGGRSDISTIAAIDKFESEMLAGASNAYFVSEDAHFEEYGEYSVDALTLNGFDIYDFSFIYEDGESKRIAEILREYISRESGYLLDVTRGEIDDTSRGIAIIIDDDMQQGSALVLSDGGKISLIAPDTYGLSVSAAKFAQMIGEAVLVNNGKLAIPVRTELSYNSQELSLSFITAGTEDQSNLGFVLDFVATVKEQNSDIICFAPLDEALAGDIRLDVPNGYELLTLSLNDGKKQIVLYKKSVFTSAVHTLEGEAAYLSLTCTDGGVWRVLVCEKGDRLSEAALSGLNAVFIGGENNAPALEHIRRLESGKSTYNIYKGNDTDLRGELALNESLKDDSFITVCQFELVREYCTEFIFLEQTEK